MAIPPIFVIERTLRDAGIPIDGVSVGTPADRSTWKAFYQASATDPQKVQGDALLLSLDLADPTVLNEIRGDFALAANTDLLQAVAQALWEAIPGPLLTKAQLKARVLALYKATL